MINSQHLLSGDRNIQCQTSQMRVEDSPLLSHPEPWDKIGSIFEHRVDFFDPEHDPSHYFCGGADDKYPLSNTSEPFGNDHVLSSNIGDDDDTSPIHYREDVPTNSSIEQGYGMGETCEYPEEPMYPGVYIYPEATSDKGTVSAEQFPGYAEYPKFLAVLENSTTYAPEVVLNVDPVHCLPSPCICSTLWSSASSKETQILEKEPHFSEKGKVKNNFQHLINGKGECDRGHFQQLEYTSEEIQEKLHYATEDLEKEQDPDQDNEKEGSFQSSTIDAIFNATGPVSKILCVNDDILQCTPPGNCEHHNGNLCSKNLVLSTRHYGESSSHARENASSPDNDHPHNDPCRTKSTQKPPSKKTKSLPGGSKPFVAVTALGNVLKKRGSPKKFPEVATDCRAVGRNKRKEQVKLIKENSIAKNWRCSKSFYRPDSESIARAKEISARSVPVDVSNHVIPANISNVTRGVQAISKSRKKVAKFPCPCCEKSFSSREGLESHCVMHTGDKPYSCPVPSCGMRYRWRSSISYHCDKHFEDGEIVLEKEVGPVATEEQEM